jgi:hypothetical protein
VNDPQGDTNGADHQPHGSGCQDSPMNGGFAHERPESRYCQGKTRAGTPCKRTPCPGRNYCTLHGGRSPIGPAHGRWRDGRYSKFMPKTLAADYRRAVSDPRLLELDSEVAILQTRIASLLREMGQADAPPWSASVESLNDLVLAVRNGRGIDEALAAHASVVRSGASAARNAEQLWERLQKTVELKAKVSSAEWKRQVDLQCVLPAAQAMNLVAGLLAAVEDIILDAEGNRELYRRVCQRAIHYLPVESRPYAAGSVIDNAPPDSDKSL